MESTSWVRTPLATAASPPIESICCLRMWARGTLAPDTLRTTVWALGAIARTPPSETPILRISRAASSGELMRTILGERTSAMDHAPPGFFPKSSSMSSPVRVSRSRSVLARRWSLSWFSARNARARSRAESMSLRISWSMRTAVASL